MQVMFNRLFDPMSQKFWVATLLFTCLSLANAQPRALLEACNAIDDKAKRMECLEQLMQLQGTTSSSPQATTLKRAKSAFAAIASTVQSGVSFNNYSVLIMDPAKELGVLRQEAPTLDPLVFEKLQAAVAAYNDAASVWRASIYQSQDGGFMGRVLNPEQTGLMPIVNKYGLYTTTVLFNTHLPADAAVGKIWRYAEMTATEAFEIAEGTPRPKLEPAGALPTVAPPLPQKKNRQLNARHEIADATLIRSQLRRASRMGRLSTPSIAPKETLKFTDAHLEAALPGRLFLVP